jgi:hypothetical protein
MPYKGFFEITRCLYVVEMATYGEHNFGIILSFEGLRVLLRAVRVRKKGRAPCSA